MDTSELTLGHAPAHELAPQHTRRPCLAANAVGEARQAAPDLYELALHVVPRMPRRPLASQTIRAITRDRYSAPMLLDDAVTCPWVSLDSEQMVNAIAVDADHSDADEWAEDLATNYGLRRPTVVMDPWSGRAHVIAMLATPVLVTPDAKLGPQILFDLAGLVLAAAMRGTLMPPRSLVKSPWGLRKHLIGERLRRTPTPAVPGIWDAYVESGSPLMWRTFPGDCHAYELREIIAALVDDFGEEAAAPKTRRRFRKRRPEPSSLGRNCALFDSVRFWAYDRHERDGGAILEQARQVNGAFATPLSESEVAATARSIARFMNKRYRPRHGADASRGRDAADGAGLDVKAKRALAGQKSAAANRAATDAKIAAGVAAVMAAGQPLTQAAVAAAAGVSLRTVKARWHVVQKVQDGALSGSAAASAAPGPQGLPLQGNQNLSSTLAEKAQADRKIRRTVRALEASIAANRRPGAEPVEPPEVAAVVGRDPAVRKALAEARQAHADSRRRSEQRVARETAQARAAVFRQMAAALDGWAQFRAHLDALDAEFDHLESLATRFELGRIRAQREAVFAGRWRQWRAAMDAVGRHARVDDLIPW